MTTTMHRTAELVTEVCCTCGCVFAWPKVMRDHAIRKGPSISFYCPNGHAQHFTHGREALAKKLEKELRAELQAERQRRTLLQEQLEARARSLAATRGQITKIKRRAANGVCPCCNRTFANLARHMASKHPDFDKEHAHEQ